MVKTKIKGTSSVFIF